MQVHWLHVKKYLPRMELVLRLLIDLIKLDSQTADEGRVSPSYEDRVWQKQGTKRSQL